MASSTYQHIKMLSSSAYHALRTSGFVKLPSERTLRDYTHHFENKPGFLKEVDQQLIDEANLSSLPESKKFVAILIEKSRRDLYITSSLEKLLGWLTRVISTMT